MLTWVEGPRDRGCAYHKKARFRTKSAFGQVDVFVMPKIAKARPIPVTLNVTTSTGGEKRLKGSLMTPSEAETLRGRLPARLGAIGVADRLAAGIVDDIISLIRADAKAIQAALAASPR